MSVTRLPLRVYIEDTDAGGIVYYVNYLKYMERARTEFMRAHGFDKRYIFNSDLMFVVHSLKADYRDSAELDDEIEATAEILHCGRAAILFRQQVWRDSQLLCDAEVKIACVAKNTRKPQRIPAEMLASLIALGPGGASS